MRHITRIAPSPSGYFHLGTARTAYFNWLAARATGGTFILRIDDTDSSRSNDAYIDVIHDAMKYLGLDHDLSFRQSDRAMRYRDVAYGLLAKGLARVDGDAVRLASGLRTQTVHDDAMGTLKASQIDIDFISDMVLLRSDGSATYHFASVVDDVDFGVTFVIRGADHGPNIFKQVALYDALGAPLPRYAHVGLLHDLATGKKLSKSDGAKSLLDFRDAGIDPDAMCNFLLRLGWGPAVDDRTTAMLPRDKALALFLAGGRMRAAPSKVDLRQLASLDRKYTSAKRTAGA